MSPCWKNLPPLLCFPILKKTRQNLYSPPKLVADNPFIFEIITKLFQKNTYFFKKIPKNSHFFPINTTKILDKVVESGNVSHKVSNKWDKYHAFINR